MDEVRLVFDQMAKANTDPGVMERRRLYAEAASGLLKDLDGKVPDLALAGIELTHISDLYRYQVVLEFADGRTETRPIDYRAAVPILVDWLPMVRNFFVVTDIVEALSKKFAKKQARPLFLKMFRDTPPIERATLPETTDPIEWVRTSIGQGLAVFADPSVADEYIELALDRSYKFGRPSIIQSLPKVKDERVPRVLLSLLDDPAVSHQVIDTLGKIRYAPAADPIREIFENLPEDWDSLTAYRIQDAAKKALKRLEG